MIDPKTVKKGDRLVYRATNQNFVVLCNCPSARPKHFTQRYVKNNPHEFDYPEEST